MGRLKEKMEREYLERIERSYEKLLQARENNTRKNKIESRSISIDTVKAAFKEVLQESQGFDEEEEIKAKAALTLLQ